jgi:hypothetical protein
MGGEKSYETDVSRCSGALIRRQSKKIAPPQLGDSLTWPNDRGLVFQTEVVFLERPFLLSLRVFNCFNDRPHASIFKMSNILVKSCRIG